MKFSLHFFVMPTRRVIQPVVRFIFFGDAFKFFFLDMLDMLVMLFNNAVGLILLKAS